MTKVKQPTMFCHSSKEIMSKQQSIMSSEFHQFIVLLCQNSKVNAELTLL